MPYRPKAKTREFGSRDARSIRAAANASTPTTYNKKHKNTPKKNKIKPLTDFVEIIE